ncbi:MAG TPA: ATP-binding protein [Actinomycetales bacterium]
MSEHGSLRVYLGAAPGVGKTFAMLDEGHRRRERGTDVVVGFVETHGRPRTAEAVGDLEVVPRRQMSHRGATFPELDLDALLARRPQVALVDELAHTNVPGSRNDKRWQDVHELLAAGIDVVTTVNIQHLESLNDVVLQITGVPQRETVPDVVVRSADQIELVDMSPQSLRRRLAHGNVYRPDKIDAALSNYFRVGNLGALRELALLWLADRVDEGLQHYRDDNAIAATWAARERVVVAVTGGPESDTLIRRAARIAARANGGDLLAVHVTSGDGLRDGSSAERADLRRLVESLGGTWHSVVGDDRATALIDFARAENATQLVVGASRRGRWSRFVGGAGVGQLVSQRSGDIDVHLVGHDRAATGRALPTLTGGLDPRRRLVGAAVAVALSTVLTVGLATFRAELNLTSEALLYLSGVVVVALVGGLWPALGMALVSTIALNYFFTEPVGRFAIAERNNVLALLVFVAVAAAVSTLVDTAARRTRLANRARAEAETLGLLAVSVLRGDDAVPALVERVRETFAMSSVSLLRRHDDAWAVIACTGESPCLQPSDADVEIPVATDVALVMRGRRLAASDRRVLAAFAGQAAVLLEREELRREAEQAGPLAEAGKMRTALLNAVGHDLRTPLASAKAAVTSLRSDDVRWTPEQAAELLDTADGSLDRLARLVDNLLDMSRVNAGAVTAYLRPVGWDEVVPGALDELGEAAARVRLQGLGEAPSVLADAALLERVVVNLIGNALRHSGSDTPLVSASALGDRVELRVADTGPGIPTEQRDLVFQPFQRLGDHDNTTGVGLGLALSRGLVEAMQGTLDVEDTPGGGVTMVVSLPVAPSREPPAREPQEAVA